MIHRIFLIVLLVVLGNIGVIPISHAADSGSVVLSSLTPQVPRATDTVRLSGQIVNSSSTNWSDVSIDIRIGSSALLGRFQLNEWLKGQERTTRVVTTISVGAVPAGMTRQWSAAIPAKNLGLALTAKAQGVYPLLIDSTTAVTPTRSLLTWAPVSGAIKPSPTAFLIPLTWMPSRISDGRFLNTTLLSEIALGGRLNDLLDAGVNRNVTWLVDPSLVQALTDLATGPSKVLENGEFRDIRTEESQRASAWLGRARSILTTANTYVLPAGNADLVGLADADQKNIITDLVNRGQQALARDLSVVAAGTAVLAQAGTTPAIESTLLASGVDVIVTTSKALPGRAEVYYTPSSVVKNSLVVDDDISSMIASGSPAQDVVAALSMVGFELPQSPRSLAVTAPSLTQASNVANTLAGLTDQRSQKTVSLVTLPDLMAAPANDIPRTAAKFPTNPSLVMGINDVRAVNSLNQRISVLAQLAATELDQQIIRNQLVNSVDAAWSVVWNGDQPAREQYLAQQLDYIKGLESAVEVSSAERVMLSGDRGIVPVTIRNGLPWPITVRLTASSSAGVRASLLEAPTVINVAPGERAGVELRIRVVGTATVPLVIRALTADGQAVGAPISVAVGSAAYARVATYVVFGSFVLLSLLVLRSTVRRIKRSRSREEVA